MTVLDDLSLDEVLVRYTALLEQIKAMQDEAEAMRSDALVRAARDVRALMSQYNLRLEDVEPPARAPRAPYNTKKKQREAAAEAARTPRTTH